MNIVPVNKGGRHRTGTLDDINVATINEILGFEPNVSDDPDKVKHSWGFEVDGEHCGIWDYKGSHYFGSFSTYGSAEIFQKLFPAHYV